MCGPLCIPMKPIDFRTFSQHRTYLPPPPPNPLHPSFPFPILTLLPLSFLYQFLIVLPFLPIPIFLNPFPPFFYTCPFFLAIPSLTFTNPLPFFTIPPQTHPSLKPSTILLPALLHPSTIPSSSFYHPSSILRPSFLLSSPYLLHNSTVSLPSFLLPSSISAPFLLHPTLSLFHHSFFLLPPSSFYLSSILPPFILHTSPISPSPSPIPL